MFVNRTLCTKARAFAQPRLHILHRASRRPWGMRTAGVSQARRVRQTTTCQPFVLMGSAAVHCSLRCTLAVSSARTSLSVATALPVPVLSRAAPSETLVTKCIQGPSSRKPSGFLPGTCPGNLCFLFPGPIDYHSAHRTDVLMHTPRIPRAGAITDFFILRCALLGPELGQYHPVSILGLLQEGAPRIKIGPRRTS